MMKAKKEELLFLTDIDFKKREKEIVEEMRKTKVQKKEVFPGIKTLSKNSYDPKIATQKEDSRGLFKNIYQFSLQKLSVKKKNRFKNDILEGLAAYIKQISPNEKIPEETSLKEEKEVKNGLISPNCIDKQKKKNKIVQDLLEKEEMYLVQLKKQYNKNRYELQRIKKVEHSLKLKLECLPTMEDPLNVYNRNRQNEELAKQINTSKFDIEVYLQMYESYKKDLILINKKHEVLKRVCAETNLKYKSFKNNLENEEELIKYYKNKDQFSKCEKGKEELDDDKNKYSFFEEITKYLETMQAFKTVKEEEVNTNKLQIHNRELIRLRLESEQCIVLKEYHSKCKNLDDLNSEIYAQNFSLSKIMDTLLVSDKSNILQKIKEIFISKQVIVNLKNDLDFEKKHQQLTSDKTEDSFRIDKLNHNESLFFYNNVYDIDKMKIVYKEKINELTGLNQKNKHLANQFLSSTSVFSRIIFQLSPQTLRQTVISEQTLVSLMTFIGLRLEQIVKNFLEENPIKILSEDIEDDKNINFETFRLNAPKIPL